MKSLISSIGGGLDPSRWRVLSLSVLAGIRGQGEHLAHVVVDEVVVVVRVVDGGGQGLAEGQRVPLQEVPIDEMLGG